MVFPGLVGKVALITGASSGIGAATALYLNSCGVKMCLSGRNSISLEKIAQQCSKDNVMSLSGDLLIDDYRKKLLSALIRHFGKLDILINCAGILETGSIENTTLEQFDRLFNMNVRTIYHLTMLSVPYLVKTQGSIVNVSSVNGIRAFPNVLAYNMSKAALDQFTRSIALELAPKKIRVNNVNPGVTVTQLHKRGGISEEDYIKFLERCKETHALGRPGKPEEIANAIAFLACTDSSGFITGACLPVDGGRHAMCPR